MRSNAAGMAGGGASGVAGSGAQAGHGGTTNSGTGGTPNAPGGMSAGGMAGVGASGDPNGGSLGTSDCPVTATSVQSTAIPTVFTVTFTTTLPNVASAEIEFGRMGASTTMVAPVDLTQPNYATYLLGMKQSATYIYRIKLTMADGTSCRSPDHAVTTGTLTGAPTPQIALTDPAHHAPGFIVQNTNAGAEGRVFILDSDGDVVWLSPNGVLVNDVSRAHFSWDARQIYAVRGNPNNAGGSITAMAVDGTNVRPLPNTDAAHHDLAAIPGGLAILRWHGSDASAPTELVEISDDGSEKTVLTDVANVYASSAYHPNSIHYYARDDSYTLGDTDPSLYVKLTRSGELVWQFGGANPKDPAKNFDGVTPWQANHGHHLAADGTFAFFNNGPGFGPTGVTMCAAVVYKLDESNLKATPVTTFTGLNSWILGDVQLLPNGNVLVTASMNAVIAELTPAGDTVLKLSGFGQLGYSEFRTSLYGTPQY